MAGIPTIEDIGEAAERIKPHAHRNPVLTCRGLDRLAGCRLFFKCENFQKVGAFKFRGACNAVFSLGEDEIKNGVATHSSGNHAAALAPVGGGGLSSGTCLAVKGVSPNTPVIGAEPQGADDACRSLQAGRIIPSVDPDTIADGLLTSLGELTFAVLSKHMEKIITVSDPAIILAMRHVWERMKIIIEPSSAVPVAAVLENKDDFSGKRVGVIISGGNLELSRLPFGVL